MFQKDFKVTITGFKNKREAQEFISWYENQGEQFIQDWMEARKYDEEDDDSLEKIESTFHSDKIDEENLTFSIK